MNPSQTEALVEIHDPKTATKLSELLYYKRWMCISIADYARRIAPPNEVLEEAYTKSKHKKVHPDYVTRKSLLGAHPLTASQRATGEPSLW